MPGRHGAESGLVDMRGGTNVIMPMKQHGLLHAT